MKRIRVLVVDDSVVVRRILKDVLTTDPEVEVVGVAANGRIALSMIDQLNPDVVTLDLEMPEMDGLEVLRQLQTTQPQLPVIIFSTHTQRGAVATLEALSLGARDYVTKPAIAGSVGSGMEKIREELLPRLKALCGVRAVPASTTLRTRPAAGKPPAPRTTPKAPIEILAIGSSTGGPNALAEVLPRLPADFPVPVVVVQHMPPTFTRFLAERLNTNCQLRVAEAAMDQALLPGTIWIAPGDFHMSVYAERANRRLRTHQTPPENSCRPSVDVLFRSIAEIFGARCLAVVMTGMGQDGLRGAEHLHRAGAQIVVQDEETSVVWGMPGYIARAGLADQVLPLSSIAMSIVNRVKDNQRPVPSMGEPVGCRLVR